MQCGSPSPGPVRGPTAQKEGKGYSPGCQSPSVPHATLHPTPTWRQPNPPPDSGHKGPDTSWRRGEALPRACSGTACTRGRHTWRPTPGGPARANLRLGACAWGLCLGACSWGPAPGGLHREGLYRGLSTGARARAVFPSSHLMPARYLSSPSISLSSKNRKGTG